MQFFNTNDWQAQVKNALWRWLKLGTIVSTLFSVTGYLGGLNLYFELTSHFRLQYLVFGFCALILFLISRKNKFWLAAIACCLAINIAEILPWYLPNPGIPASPDGQPLRVLLSNVLTSNRQPDRVISLIREEKPDIAVFLEINDAWSAALKPIQDILPNAVVHPREDNFGIALYSRLPLANEFQKEFGVEEIVSILADITFNKQKVSIIATHPLPPIGQEYFEGRNKQLEEISLYVQQVKNPKIVIGDLNMTMWSPYYKNFVQKTGLRNARQGFGIQPTWPTLSPLLYIPLDHCLVSPEIKVVKSRIGRNIGSDHLPAIADLAIPTKS